MKVTIELVLKPDANPEAAAEAAFDLLCSVGDNPDACERFDTLVHTVDGYDFRPGD